MPQSTYKPYQLNTNQVTILIIAADRLEAGLKSSLAKINADIASGTASRIARNKVGGLPDMIKDAHALSLHIRLSPMVSWIDSSTAMRALERLIDKPVPTISPAAVRYLNQAIYNNHR